MKEKRKKRKNEKEKEDVRGRGSERKIETHKPKKTLR